MKALFNIKRLQISKLTESNGTYTYGTPIQIPGTVSLSMDIDQSIELVYADGVAYVAVPGAVSTTGTLENYFIPTTVLTQIYRYVVSSNGEYLETDDQPYSFGMQFACDNDEGDEVYFTYYNVSSTKPGINLQTKESSTTINPQSVDLTASPITVGTKQVVKSFATKDATNYSTYFTAITVPTIPTSL